MRVTDNMSFNTTISNIFNSKSQLNDTIAKIGSQKNINRASDNPTAAMKIIDIEQGKAANDQYRNNMDSANIWISATDTTLSSVSTLLGQASEIAIGQENTAASERTSEAQNVQFIIDSMASVANQKSGDRYLFSGSRNDVAPFSTTSLSPTIEAAGAAPGNTFQGTVTSSGVYTGSTNNTYVVKITNAGPLATAKYQFSTDGGKTWNGTDLALAGGSINLGDGVTLTFNDAGGTKPFGVTDIFHVNATIGGYYSGNDEDLSAMINRGTSLNYNISGAQVFTAAANNGNGVDVFATLNALKDALNNNDTQGISNQIDNLQKAQSQITMNQSLCGVKQNQIEVTKNSLTNLDTNLDSLLSKTQDADTAKLAVQLSMEQTVLEASYSIANKIGKMTILDFLS